MYTKEQLIDLIEKDVDNEDANAILEKVEKILEQEPDNPYAIKLKVDMLYNVQKYKDALKICDEYLLNNPNDVEMLKSKADALFAEEKYMDCVLVCRNILHLDPKNKGAKSLIETAQMVGDLPDEACGINPLKHKVKIVSIAVIILLAIIFTQPTSEVLECDGHYNCQIRHEFCHFITIKRDYKLNPGSQINISSGIRWQKGGSKHIARIKYDNKKTFIADIVRTSYSEDLDRRIRDELDKFWRYKRNPQAGYTVKSSANPWNLWVFLFFYFLIAISLLIPVKSEKNR